MGGYKMKRRANFAPICRCGGGEGAWMIELRHYGSPPFRRQAWVAVMAPIQSGFGKFCRDCAADEARRRNR